MKKCYKYKNFIPVSKYEESNKKQDKRFKTFILLMIAINAYLFPVNIMKVMKEESMQNRYNIENKIEDNSLNILNILNEGNVELYSIENNILNIEMDRGEEQHIIDVLEDRGNALKSVNYEENKVYIKVGI